MKALAAVPWAFAWMILMAGAFRLPTAAAAAAMGAILVVFLLRNVARPLRTHPPLAARLRLGPIGRYLPLLTLAVAAKLILMMSGIALHEEGATRRMLPRLPEDPEFVPAAFMADPLGGVALVLAIAVLAPLIEEFAFRGKMQLELERSLGLTAAILVPALVFSVLHGIVDAIHHLPFGIFAGWLVWRTASIWGAVYMHALNNLVVAGLLYLPDGSSGENMPAGLWRFALVAGPVALGALIAIGARVHTIASRTRPQARVCPAERSAHPADPATAGG